MCVIKKCIKKICLIFLVEDSMDFEKVLNKQVSWQLFLNQQPNKHAQQQPIKLGMRSPLDGKRKTISLWSNTPLKVIFFYIAGEMGLNPNDYCLILDYPKRRFTIEDFQRTLAEVGFGAQEMVYIERI